MSVWLHWHLPKGTTEGMTFKWVSSINNLVSQNIVKVTVNGMWTFHVPSNTKYGSSVIWFQRWKFMTSAEWKSLAMKWTVRRRWTRFYFGFFFLLCNILWFWIWMGEKPSKSEKCDSWMSAKSWWNVEHEMFYVQFWHRHVK